MDRLLENKNFVKIVALFLAVALWFVVNGGDISSSPQNQRSLETYRISEVSLVAKVDDARLAIVKIPKTVTVELKGTPLALAKNIAPSDYEVYVDLQNYTKGTHEVPVSYRGFPSDVSIRVIPDKVQVVLEEKQRVEKEVMPQFIGNTAEGYSVGEAIVKPKKVHITVPESKIKQIGQVQATINIDDAKDLIEQTVPLRVLDKRGNPLDAEVNPAVVDVDVPVTSPYKSLPINVSYINHPPNGYSIDNIRLINDKITVYGPLEIIGKLNFYPGPQVDLSAITEDRFLQLKVPLLPNVSKTEPEFIELEVDVTKSTEKTFEELPITVNGLGDGLKVAFVNPENGAMSLTVIGSAKKLSGMKPEDIEMYIDVSNLPPGEHEVPVHLNLPTFVTSKTATDLIKAVVQIEKNE